MILHYISKGYLIQQEISTIGSEASEVDLREKLNLFIGISNDYNI